MVDPHEVQRALDELRLLRREPRQPFPDPLPHRLRVVPEEERIREPPELELLRPLGRLHVHGSARHRLVPHHVERHPQLPLLRRPVLVPVDSGDGGVGEDEVVGDDVGLGAGVARLAVEVEQHGAAAGRLQPGVVALHGHRVRLVHRDPVLHPVPERREARLRVTREVVSVVKTKEDGYCCADGIN